MGLVEVLTNGDKRAAVVVDCLELIDLEVADKRGLSGMAIKAGYKAVKGISPGFLQKVVHDLIPAFAGAVEPIYVEAKDQGVAVGSHFVAERDRVADCLLAITDERANRTKSGVVKATYGRLRGTAKKNVSAAAPRLGALLERHTA